MEINNAECKNKETALSILQAIAGNQKSILQKLPTKEEFKEKWGAYP